MLLSFGNLTKYFGDKRILAGVSASVEDNDRIGIIGRNGTGKTTLLNILCADLPFDEGNLNYSRKTSIGYLRQNSGLESDSTIYEEMRKIFSDLIEMNEEIKRLEKQISILSQSENSAEYKQIMEKYASLSTVFEQRDGYNIDVKIKTVLNGMGFMDKDLDTVINTLSGGERTRLSLSRLLLLHPKLLVLDEPTNHLDFETLCWLEDYLKDYKGAVITVSHDRFFLDKLATTIWEIEDEGLKAYKGNYSKFLILKEEAQARQLKEYEIQQKKIADLQDYVDRNLVRASTSKSAKSKRNVLERMEIIDKPKTFTKKMPIKFEYDFEPNFEVLKLTEYPITVGLGNDKITLCDDVSFTLERGDKLAISGANGTGKTTLLRAIKNHPSLNSKIRWGGNVKIGYYDQHLEVLNPENTVLEELWNRFPNRDPLSIRTTLGRALFSGESIEKKVSDLSGGEKARLSLAILMEMHPNVLIMDEPTNHLDLMVREMLEKALLEYEGTLILVSHDRYFLEKIPNKILNLKGGMAQLFKGGYAEFTACLENEKTIETQNIQREKKEKSEVNTGHKSREQRKQEAEKRNELSRLEKEVASLEKRINAVQNELSDPDTYADFKRSSELCQELEKLKAQHEEALEKWLILSDE